MLLFEANAICETIDGWVKKNKFQNNVIPSSAAEPQ
jgi:hypothetical protein